MEANTTSGVMPFLAKNPFLRPIRNGHTPDVYDPSTPVATVSDAASEGTEYQDSVSVEIRTALST